jgi:hypothetical protein
VPGKEKQSLCRNPPLLNAVKTRQKAGLALAADLPKAKRRVQIRTRRVRS